MKIKLTSVFVDYQEKALKFYVEVLGSVDISTESDKSGDKTQKSKITGS